MMLNILAETMLVAAGVYTPVQRQCRQPARRPLLARVFGSSKGRAARNGR